VRWKFENAQQEDGAKVLKYAFWSFGPAIHAFRCFRPVLSVDRTHLRGAYKGKLLVAVCKTSDNNIMPVAYALVPKESFDSWKWFIDSLRRYILGGRPTCIISDRDKGLIKAMRWMINNHPGLLVHRFCLEHVKANLCNQFRMKGLKGACQMLGKALQEHKYEELWERIENLHPEGAAYLRGIDPSMWTLYADEGWRWGMTTTNISESYNNVLRGARRLPIRALVECTLSKVVESFRKNREKILTCDTPLPPYYMTKLDKHRAKATSHMVEEWAGSNICFTVRTIDDNVHDVRYVEQTCSCGKWQHSRFPCSHAIAVALKLEVTDFVSLMHPFYTKQAWMDQFSMPFYPILGSLTWPIVDWKLRPDESRLVQYGGPGRRRQNRFPGAMDYMRGQGRGERASLCTRCGSTRHNARRCPLTHPSRDS